MTENILIEIKRGHELVGAHTVTPGEEICVGRNEESHICLPDKEVSRRHATLRFAPQSVVVRDHSYNGITFEGKRLEGEQTLALGATIQIGAYSVILGRHPPAETQKSNDFKRIALERLIEHIDLTAVQSHAIDLRHRVEASLERIVLDIGLPEDADLRHMIQELTDEALGLGPLEPLLRDPAVTEIMVVDQSTIYAEQNGRLEKTPYTFTSEAAVRTVIDRIIAPLGRRIDELSPMVDARLADGSRVNAVIPPLAIRGSSITIRKFSKTPFGMKDLVRFGSVTEEMASLLQEAVAKRANIVISGGTGSGKTTLLGALSGAISSAERIVTIEDAAELRLPQSHVVSLESRPPNAEGKGEVTIRALVRNALRMRPDRIVVGECRGGEALDMLQAMNTGHDGSLTTLHANTPAEAVSRLETLCLMAGLDLPSRAIREQIASAIDIIVQQARLPDGTRRVTSITEMLGLEDDGRVQLCEIYRFVRNNSSSGGIYLATGWLPQCLNHGAVDAEENTREAVRS